MPINVICAGVTNLYQYEVTNRLTNVLWRLNANTLASFHYRLGLAGHRTNLSELVNGISRTYAWRHDRLYRLTNELISGAAPTGSLSYGYDRVGNRTNRSSTLGLLGNQNFTFNHNDWLTTNSYDNNGNTVGSSCNTYQYDVKNRLTNATVNGVTVLPGYNGDGIRVRRTIGATNIFYLVDDRNLTGYAQVLEEHQSIGGQPATLSRGNCSGAHLRRPGT